MIEPEAMQEIHEIREAIYGEQKNMSRDEILQSLHTPPTSRWCKKGG